MSLEFFIYFYEYKGEYNCIPIIITMAKVDSIDQTDLDLVDVLNTVLPFEKHLPGMNYCGPGSI